MISTSPSLLGAGSAANTDAFEVLDACHRQTLVMLDSLSQLVTTIDTGTPDSQARATAREIVRFFSTTARQHHEDEELHVFPQLLGSADAEIVQAVLRLKQDHHWMDVDWRELSPALAGIAENQGGYDLEALREAVEIFTALSREHIALEESCIYPRARAGLRAAQLQQMGREMAERRRVRLAARRNPSGESSSHSSSTIGGLRPH